MCATEKGGAAPRDAGARGTREQTPPPPLRDTAGTRGDAYKNRETKAQWREVDAEGQSNDECHADGPPLGRSGGENAESRKRIRRTRAGGVTFCRSRGARTGATAGGGAAQCEEVSAECGCGAGASIAESSRGAPAKSRAPDDGAENDGKRGRGGSLDSRGRRRTGVVLC